MPSIKFDTTVETSQVVSGFKDIQNAIQQTADKATGSGKSLDTSMQTGANSVEALKQKLQTLNQTLSDLNAKIAEQKSYAQESALAISSAKDAYEAVKKSRGEYAARLSEEGAELRAVQKAHEEDTLVLRGYNLEVSKTKLEIAETIAQLKQFGADGGNEADAIQQLIDKIEAWKAKLQDVQVLSEKFNAQNDAVQSLSQSITNLSQSSADYTAKAQSLLGEINQISAALRLTGEDLKPEEKAQAIDTLRQKITEYGQAVTESSASAQTAFTLQQQVVQSLEQTITSLQADLQGAAAAGNDTAVNAIQGQINSLNKELTDARSNLASLQQQAQSAAQAMEGVASVQETLSQGATRGGSIFGNIVDEATLIKDKVSSVFESLSNTASAKLEPIKNKFQEVGQSVSTAFSNLSQKIGLDRLGEVFSSVGDKLVDYKQKVVDAATGHGKFQQSLSNMKTALNGLPIPLGNVITSIGSVTKALWSMCATPIGAVIAAIVVGLRAMYTWFTKSADGQKAFTALSAYFGSLMSSITDIVMIFGKYLYHAFADANGPLNAFAKALIVTFRSAIKTVSKLVGGLGTTLKGIFTLDWDTFKSGVSEMGEGLSSAVGTVLNAVDAQIKGVTGALKLFYKAATDDKLGNELGNAFNSMADKASKAKNLAMQELNANIELGKAKEKEASMDRVIADEMNQVYKLTGKAKEEQIAKLKALKQEKYDAIIAAQDKLYKTQQAKNKLHTVTLEDLKQERDLHISLLTTQAQRVSSLRMLSRLEASNERKMASAAKSAAKKAASEAKKGLSQENAQTSAQAKEDELIRKNTAARVKAAQDIEDAVTDARISAMKDGEEKVIAERNRELQKELAQNEAKRVAAVEAERQRQKAEFEASEAVRKSASKSYVAQAWDDSKLDNSFIDAINKQYKEIADLFIQKANQETEEKELQAMRDYLKEYGSLYQQKQAIAEDYEDKIAKAQTEGEKKSLRQQKKKALASLDFENISLGIDWKGLMSGVGSMSKEMLKPMFDKLEAYTKTAEFQQAGTENQQKVVDLMQEIRSYLGTDQNTTWQTLAQAIQDFNQSVVDFQKAQEGEKKAQTNLSQAKTDLKNGKITQQAFDKIKKAADQASEAVVDTRDKMNTFGVQLNATTDAVKNYTSGLTAALNKLGAWKGAEGYSSVQSSIGNIDALKGALDESLSTMADGQAKTIGSALSNTMGKTLGSLGSSITSTMGSAIGSIVGVVAQIPQLILNLASSIKNFVTGILNSFTELLKFQWLSDLVDSILGAVGNLIDAIFDLPENIYKALESIVTKGVGGLLNTVVGRIGNVLSLGKLSSSGPASWFTNSNAKKVADTIERLTDRNELLQKSIENLTDAMEDTYGQKATDLYKQAYKNQQETNQNYLEIAKAQAGYHGSHHSWSHDWSGFSDEELKWIRNNVNKDFNGDLFSLTPEEMKLLQGNVEIWKHIQDTGSYGDRLTDKLNDYISQAGKLEELSDKYKENLTQISFDSMKDSFISNLMDMTKSAQDFSDDFAEMLQKALLSYSMQDLINGDLKKLYDDWAKAIEDSKGQLTEDQIDEFNKRYDDIVNEGLKRRDDWSKLTGYTGSSSQTATSGGWASMGQETADELNGRFTALQIAGESIAQNMETTIAMMETIMTLGISTNGAVLEIRNMMIMTNSYLEDVVRYAKLTYNDFGSKLDDMNNKLKNI